MLGVGHYLTIPVLPAFYQVHECARRWSHTLLRKTEVQGHIEDTRPAEKSCERSKSEKQW